MMAHYALFLQRALAPVVRFVEACARALRCRFYYCLEVHAPQTLRPAMRAELELLLTACHGVSDYSSLFSECDRVYTATYQNQTVACVFTRSLDWNAEEDQRHICNVRALSVVREHRRQGIATRLITRIKRDAAQERAVWLELHVDEKRDRSHECLLAMYRGMGFLVLPRPHKSQYILLCMDY
ncbi:MAG: GNAT family N-acetyltransferase [Gammaproteobacteria bacterium]|jgi:GNAT superfamily N-acetyltransferase|nr:GNAT family N-acetyltransferase [Gammaproteobacteria bacterium]